ncbi:hypothetical protein CC1G_13224 [Coprinopsis cinerea okayama7|uniref:Uncharacterized protein n=1 Tax=Coprinopsis cinerea (strain Okayama-7 / 130 / ATCC MYA-4618 / FGSC 9003) TaxID=240176 RepID=A8N825_COPC7|nr:hypothetical protein CC1G_13224 [Coprinopsis cinerea okayama7\|eukprot:XP_001830981.2 hypothetical protein CC1G_13224 [Coprinopsis cinerea okayama7\
MRMPVPTTRLTTFHIHRPSTVQLLHEAEFILDDALRHLHAFRVISEGKAVESENVRVFAGQSEELLNRLVHLKSLPKIRSESVKTLIRAILRWRRAVQVEEVSVAPPPMLTT